MNIVPVETRTQILEELASGEKTITAIAKEHGIARSTIYSWQKTPAALSLVKGNILTRYVNGLNDVANNVPDILEDLRAIRKDEMVKPSDRLKAIGLELNLITQGFTQLSALELLEIKAELEALRNDEV